MGYEQRRAGNHAVLAGTMTFRDMFLSQLDSVKLPLSQCIELLSTRITLDPHFRAFYDWARSAGVPIVVLSSGMEPVIRALLCRLLGHSPPAEALQVVANGVGPRDDGVAGGVDAPGGWAIQFRHGDSPFGHDKSREIRKYSALPSGVRPTLLYAGDGVSDLSAARETDLLFAKRGADLVTFCSREGFPHTVFDDWSTVLEATRAIVDGRETAASVALTAAAAEAVDRQHADAVAAGGKLGGTALTGAVAAYRA